MKHRDRFLNPIRRDKADAMCSKKKKFKSGEAGKLAGRFGQRKYECPICGHWHLTTKGVQ